MTDNDREDEPHFEAFPDDVRRSVAEQWCSRGIHPVVVIDVDAGGESTTETCQYCGDVVEVLHVPAVDDRFDYGGGDDD